MFMYASIVATLSAIDLPGGLRIRKLLISLTIDPTDLFASASQSGKFFVTWSIQHQVAVKSNPPIRKKVLVCIAADGTTEKPR
jgi:hypothetical protein